jgi:hypothetical protein
MRSFAWNFVVVLECAFSMALVCTVLAGCGGDNTLPPPVTPPAPNLAVTSPVNGATVQGDPVTIAINAKNLADDSKLTVLVNGADVTSKFSKPNAGGALSVQLKQPDVAYGKNQIQVRYDTLRADSFFLLDTALGTDPGAPGSPVNGPTALLVPIQTRVLGKSGQASRPDPNKAENWGIQVGIADVRNSVYYAAPHPIDQNGNRCSGLCYGYQILLLSRYDLSLVSNTSYEVATYDEIQPNSPFLQALEGLGAGPNDPGSITVKHSPPPACVPNGCVVVMQSLARIGYNPCYNADTTYFGTCPPFVEDPTVANLIYWLTKIGASAEVLFANGMESSNVGYSFIGNAGSGRMPGKGSIGGKDSRGNIIVAQAGSNNAQFERLGCTDTRYNNPATICDNLGWAGSANNSDAVSTGQISGAMVMDNYNLFTFTQNAPLITYSFGNAALTNDVSIVSIANGTHKYSKSLPPPQKGGFRLLILNRTHPDWDDAVQWDQVYSLDAAGLAALSNDLVRFPDGNGLFFLASMGNITHDDEDPSISPAWETMVESAQRIGGDPLTLRILGDVHQAFNPDGKDDYLLVGKQIPYAPPVFESFTAGMPSYFTAAEAGYVITRKTAAYPTSPTTVSGILKPDHQGYYSPKLQAANAPGTEGGPFAQPLGASLASASLLNPVEWPFSSTPGQRNAYKWFSLQLCCNDIRAAYINLALSPSTWLTEIGRYKYPLDNDQTLGPFSMDDFSNVEGQLATEFKYVQDARTLQNNILSMYADTQSNVGLVLQQAASDIDANIQTDTPLPPGGSAWTVIANDVLPNLANITGVIPTFGAFSRLEIGTVTTVLDDTAARSNNASGASQVQQALANEDIAVANLAQYATNQFNDSLITLGNDFKRVVTDWGRLQTVGAPIESNQLVWDPTATGTFLKAFDLSTRRRYYPLLMASNSRFFVTHIEGVDTAYHTQTVHDQCQFEHFPNAQDANYVGVSSNHGQDYSQMTGTAWLPGTIDPSGASNNRYEWDVWAIGLGPKSSDGCPLPNSFISDDLPNMYGMFLPITSTDSGGTSGFGLWRPYVFEYGGFNRITH